MKIIYQITHAILQGALTSTLVYFWGLVQTWNIEQAAISTGGLVLFLGIYGIILNVMFYHRLEGIVKLMLVSIMSSLFVTLTFILYPGLGLVLEWWVLLFLLLFSAGIAHLLLYGVIGRNNEFVDGKDFTEYG